MSTLNLDDVLTLALQLHSQEFPGYRKCDFARYVITWLERSTGVVGSKERAQIERELDEDLVDLIADNHSWPSRGKVF